MSSPTATAAHANDIPAIAPLLRPPPELKLETEPVVLGVEELGGKEVGVDDVPNEVGEVDPPEVDSELDEGTLLEGTMAEEVKAGRVGEAEPVEALAEPDVPFVEVTVDADAG